MLTEHCLYCKLKNGVSIVEANTSYGEMMLTLLKLGYSKLDIAMLKDIDTGELLINESSKL